MTISKQSLGYASPSTEVLIPPDKLQARVAELAHQIEMEYAGLELILICILKGGMSAAKSSADAARAAAQSKIADAVKVIVAKVLP